MAHLRKRVINTVSDILSAPSRAVSRFKGESADRQRKVLKKARQFDRAPSLDKDGRPTPAAKYRSAAEEIRRRNIKR